MSASQLLFDELLHPQLEKAWWKCGGAWQNRMAWLRTQMFDQTDQIEDTPEAMGEWEYKNKHPSSRCWLPTISDTWLSRWTVPIPSWNDQWPKIVEMTEIDDWSLTAHFFLKHMGIEAMIYGMYNRFYLKPEKLSEQWIVVDCPQTEGGVPGLEPICLNIMPVFVKGNELFLPPTRKGVIWLVDRKNSMHP